MEKTIIAIDGMTCQHCVMRVQKAIEGLSGIQEASVVIGQATVEFDETQIKQKEIEDAIIKAGYRIKTG